MVRFELVTAWSSKPNSTQKLKLLGEVSRYDLYYFLTHPLQWKPLRLETCICPHYLVLNFYQINMDGEIQTRDRLVINTLIPCQRTNSIQKLKLKFLDKTPKYNLYYYLTIILSSLSISWFSNFRAVLAKRWSL